jgi:hypothetical protein
MESFIVLLVFAWTIRAALVDLPYTFRGQVPPRHRVAMQRLELKQAKLARAGQRRRSGAASNYARVLWEHSWTDLTERHNRRRVRRANRATGRTSAPTGAARTYFREVTRDGRDGFWRRWDAAWRQATDRRRSGRTVATDPQEPQPAGEAADEPASEPSAGVTRSINTASEFEHADPPTEPPAATSAAGSTTQNTNQEKVPTMSANSLNLGEVSGLQSAIDFADKLASASEESVQHLEQLGAGLQAGGTGSGTVGKFSTAGDSLSAAAAALRTAVDELRQHMSVRESYEATGNQAGDKDFVTAE